MKATLLIFLLTISAVISCHAESPLLAVQDFIQKAKDGKAENVDFRSAGATKAEMLAILKRMDMEKYVFESRLEKGIQVHWWKDPKDPNLYILRTSLPSVIGFEVRFVPDEKGEGKGRYTVIGVHP